MSNAIKLSEFRKAQITREQVTTTVERINNGYLLSYSGKTKCFTTLDALVIFLTEELVRACWTPLQHDEN